VGAFWFGLFTNPHAYPLEDIHFRRFLMFDKVAATLGTGGALVGEGKGRWFGRSLWPRCWSKLALVCCFAVISAAQLM
jgi:hypothetical protein